MDNNNSLQIKTRDSNLELFRIISMIFIVAHHYVVNSGLTGVDGPIYANMMSWKSMFLLIVGAWGKIGINCFVMITGYFMCKSNISFKKFLKLFCEVYFYKIIIGVLFFAFKYEPFTIKNIIKVILPFTEVNKGFTGTYLLFFLFIPFLNILIKGLRESQHIKLIVLFVAVYSLLGTIPKFTVTFNYITWFSIIYLIASYVRIYPKNIFTKTRFWGVISTLSVAFTVLTVILCAFLYDKYNVGGPYYFVKDSNTVFCLITGFSLFMLFLNIKIKQNKFINTVASATFGVLQIHANSNAMRNWLWKDTLKNVDAYYSNYLVLHFIVSIILIYTICTIIDLIRIKLLEKPFLKFISNRETRINNWYNAKEHKFCEKYKINSSEEK